MSGRPTISRNRGEVNCVPLSVVNVTLARFALAGMALKHGGVVFGVSAAVPDKELGGAGSAAELAAELDERPSRGRFDPDAGLRGAFAVE